MSIRIKINDFFLKILYNIRHTILERQRFNRDTKLENYVFKKVNGIINIIEINEYKAMTEKENEKIKKLMKKIEQTIKN